MKQVIQIDDLMFDVAFSDSDDAKHSIITRNPNTPCEVHGQREICDLDALTLSHGKNAKTEDIMQYLGGYIYGLCSLCRDKSK